MTMNSNDRETTATGVEGPGTTAPGEGGAVGPVAHTGGGGTPTPVEPPGGFHIRLDRVDLVVPPDRLTDGKLTGRQIRELADPPIGADRDIFEIVPGGSDRKIDDDAGVTIRNWMRFFSAPGVINPGCAAGRPGHRVDRCRATIRRERYNAAG